MPNINQLYSQIPRTDIIVYEGKIIKDRYNDLPENRYVNRNIIVSHIEREYEILSYDRLKRILVLKKKEFNI